MAVFRPNFDLNATEGDVNDEVEFAIKSPAGPFGFGSAVQLDDTQVGGDDDDKLMILIFSEDADHDDAGGDDNHVHYSFLFCHHIHF